MKKILISGLEIYQNIVSPFVHQLLGIKNACKFETSCSEYAINQINSQGVIKGSALSLVRLAKCQPFYSGN